MSDILETMREYEEYSETKSEREAFAAVIDELTRLRTENEKLRARSVLIPESVQKIIDDYPAVCAERDRMRKRLDKAHGFISRADWAQFFQEEHEDARAAIEGVTEPAYPWRDIESAPKDGTPILCVKKGAGFQPEILHFEDGVFGWLTDDMGFGFHPNRQPTHWMPLQEPPR